MKKLHEGDTAPDFSLMDGEGKEYSIKQFRGKNVILYFYPQDDTETCTQQACNFRDRFPEFHTINAVLLGISPDNQQSHKKFSAKYGLPFPLLSDEQRTVLKLYGGWKKKIMFGRKYMGVIRTTFVINTEGVITKIFRNVRLKGHCDKVLEAVNV